MVGLLAVELGRGPLADQLAGLAVVGGEGDVDGVRRVGRGVERDDEQARVPRLLDRLVDARGHRGDQDALVAARRWRSRCLDLALVVALCLAGGDGEVDVVLAAASLAPFCIATKNGLIESLVIRDTATSRRRRRRFPTRSSHPRSCCRCLRKRPGRARRPASPAPRRRLRDPALLAGSRSSEAWRSFVASAPGRALTTLSGQL